MGLAEHQVLVVHQEQVVTQVHQVLQELPVHREQAVRQAQVEQVVVVVRRVLRVVQV